MRDVSPTGRRVFIEVEAGIVGYRADELRPVYDRAMI